MHRKQYDKMYIVPVSTHSQQVAVCCSVLLCVAAAVCCWLFWRDALYTYQTSFHAQPASDNALQHTAIHCSTLQHTATHCKWRSVDMSCVPLNAYHASYRIQCVASKLQCVAVRCSVLRCAAVCCGALQCVAVRCSLLRSFWEAYVVFISYRFPRIASKRGNGLCGHINLANAMRFEICHVCGVTRSCV